MQTVPNRPPVITRRTGLGSMIRLTRPNSLDRLTSITSTTRKTRLTRLTRMGRMTSYPGRLDLKVWTGWVSFLARIIIAELIIQVRLGFLGYYSCYSAGWLYRLGRLRRLNFLRWMGSMASMTLHARLTRMVSLGRTDRLPRVEGWVWARDRSLK